MCKGRVIPALFMWGMPPVRSYFITEQLFVQGSVHAFAKNRRRLLILLCLLPLILIPWVGAGEQLWIEVLLLYLVLAFFFFGITPMINRWLFRRVFRRNPLLHREQFFEITEEGLHLRSENGEARYRFDELKKVSVYPEMVLIYPMTTLFHVIPRELLSATEVELLSRCGEQ